jgi:hypothetical protein
MEPQVAADSKVLAGKVPPATEKVDLSKLFDKGLWLILFGFGGGLLALYYAGIGYFPDFTWEDALTYLALMAIIGGSLVVAYSFLLFVPGVIWSQALIMDDMIHEVLRMGTRDEPCVWSVFKRILIPFALFMLYCHGLFHLLNEHGEPFGLVALGAAASLIAVSALLVKDLLEALRLVAEKKSASLQTVENSQSIGPIRDTASLRWYRVLVGLLHIPILAAFGAKVLDDDYQAGPETFCLAALPLLAVLMDLRRRDESIDRASEPADKWSLLCRALLAFGSAALLSLAAIWFFYRIYRIEDPETGAAVIPGSLLMLCTLVVVVTNLVVSVLFHERPRTALLASFLAALLLLGAGQLLPKSEQKLPTRIMARFGFGVECETLLLTEKGGRILHQQGIDVVFIPLRQTKGVDASSRPTTGAGPMPDPPVDSKKPDRKKSQRRIRVARVNDAMILSRLGSEYLLRFETETGQKNITLPKGEVVSWSVRRRT